MTDDKGECTETVDGDKPQKPVGEALADEDDFRTKH